MALFIDKDILGNFGNLSSYLAIIQHLYTLKKWNSSKVLMGMNCYNAHLKVILFLKCSKEIKELSHKNITNKYFNNSNLASMRKKKSWSKSNTFTKILTEIKAEQRYWYFMLISKGTGWTAGDRKLNQTTDRVVNSPNNVLKENLDNAISHRLSIN